jgi:hypothetical protein
VILFIKIYLLFFKKGQNQRYFCADFDLFFCKNFPTFQLFLSSILFQKMQSTGLKNSVLAAALVVGYFLLFYILDKKLFMNPAVSWGSMVIYLAFMWKAETEERTAFGGKIDFKSALRVGFLVFLMANIAYWLFFYGVCLFDHEITDNFKNQRLSDIQQQISRGTGDPQLSNDLRKEADEIRKMGFQIGIGDVLLRLSMGTVGGFFLAAVLAFFVKTEDL